MRKITRRTREISGKIDTGRCYDIDSAIILLKKLPATKFNESVDVAINLGIDARKSEQNIRGTVILPHGIGRLVRIAVFAQGEAAKQAISSGAEFVGMQELVDQIKENEINFDFVISTPEAMKITGQVAQILGRRGLMPNLKLGNITSDISQAVKNAKSGQIRFRNDKNGIIHCAIGKKNFSTNFLEENLKCLVQKLQKIKPNQVKGNYIKKVALSTTMGIGININLISLNIN